MKNYAWVSDTSIYLSDDLLANQDFHYVPLSIILDDQVFRDSIDLSEAELYKKLGEIKNPPTTSQPPMGDFVELYQNLKENYDGAIVVHISDDLSGTFSTSVQAAELVHFPIVAINSKILSFPMTEIVRRGIAMQKAGKSVSEISRHLENLADQSETYVIVGSLEQLKRSGRINQIQYYIGTLIKLVPIIIVRDGKLTIFDKKRTNLKATEAILDQLKKAIDKGKVKKVFILHGQAPKKAAELKERITQLDANITIEISPLCAAVGVHTGEGTVAISWFNE